MNTQVIKFAKDHEIELRSDDGANLYVISRRVEFGVEYVLAVQFFNPRLDFFIKKVKQLGVVNVNPCVPSEPASLYGDLELTGTLEEVRSFINKQETRGRLWVKHLDAVARFDRFMRPCWYVPTHDVRLGLASYLNNKDWQVEPFAKVALEKPLLR